MTKKQNNWSKDVFKILKAANVRQVAYVPDAGHSSLIKMAIADNSIKPVLLTSEQEGVAVLSGAWLGGEAGVNARGGCWRLGGTEDVLGGGRHCGLGPGKG